MKINCLLFIFVLISINNCDIVTLNTFNCFFLEKYNNGYSKENIERNKKSKLDDIKKEIKEKLELPGITITGLYQYFKATIHQS